jgi:hypothetical protein
VPRWETQTPTLKGKARRELAQSLRRKYEAGSSLKDIADEISASIAYVYWMLVAADTVMRPNPIAPLGSTERAELAQMAREGYDAGLTQSAVARGLGCDHDTARTLIVEAGGTLRTTVIAGLAESARPVLAQRLRIEYEKGAGLAELSAELGCRESSVRCLLAEAGATIRPDRKIPDAQRYAAQPAERMSVREFAETLGWQPSPPRQESRPVSPEEAEQIAERYRAGETIKMLGVCFGYPYSAIRRTLLAAGVELRSRSERGPFNQTNGAIVAPTRRLPARGRK